MIKMTFPKFDATEIKYMKRCLDSGWVTQGPMVKKFEDMVKERHQVKYALATTSCTAALHLSVLSLGLGPGDEVVVPAFTWVTSAHCAEYVGAKVVFADVKQDTYNLDPVALKKAITPRTKAIIVVHLFGQAAQMDEILSIAKKYSLFVIEDAACAIGTTYKEIPVGGFGNTGCFSFHPRKIITTGEGGMITTNSSVLAKKISALRCHGFSGYPKNDPFQKKQYTMGYFDYLGFNLRLSDIQAAVGIAQMKKLNSLIKERIKLAYNYHKLLNNVDEVAIPLVSQNCGHTYQSYVIRIIKGGRKKRNRIMDYLYSYKIQTRPGTHAVHRLGYYVNKYKIKASEFPIASNCEDTTITLPLFPEMSFKKQRFVVDKLKEALR